LDNREIANPLEKPNIFLTWLLNLCQREKAAPPLSEFPGGGIRPGQNAFGDHSFRGILGNSKTPFNRAYY
jgi:hypothetical protein